LEATHVQGAISGQGGEVAVDNVPLPCGKSKGNKYGMVYTSKLSIRAFHL